MEIVIAIMFVLFFSVMIWKLAIFDIKCIKKSWVIGLFLIKLASGVALSLLYSHFYGDGKLSGDTAHYYNDGQVLNGVFFESPSDYVKLLFVQGDEELVQERMPNSQHWTRSDLDQFNDNRFIIRINSLISFVAFNSYYVHVIIFILLSLIGFILFFKSIQDFIPKYQKEIFLLLVLFPSMLFWTSSILKESLLVFGFGMLTYGIRFFGQNPLKKSMLIALGMLVLLNTKVYFLLCLFPALIAYFWMNSKGKINLLKFGGLLVFGIVFLFLNSFSNSFNVTQFISKKQKDFKLVGKGGVYFMDKANFYRLPYAEKEKLRELKASVSLKEDVQVEVKPFGADEYTYDSILKAGNIYELYEIQEPSNSYFEVPHVDEKWLNLVAYSPVYIMNVLLMPYPWQKASVLKWLNILENLMLFFLLFLSIYFRRKVKEIDQKLLYFSLVFILLFYLIIGSTTPVVGAIVRYKTPAFLIWILLFLSIIDLERITLKSNKTKE